MNSGFDLKPSAPLFFLSYAHARRPVNSPSTRPIPNKSVVRFFADLSADVAELVGRPPGANPGFMDASMGGGERWEAELIEAVGTCQVFIPLVSPGFITSEWCGKEWDAFTRRSIHPRPGRKAHPTAILPVLWAPVDTADLPAAISAVQMFTPADVGGVDIATPYREEGVYGLIRLRQRSIYPSVTWRLAQKVADIYKTSFVEKLELAGEKLDNAFEERPR